ncbi:MAG TPA: winged helix-turn-helix domain-containing protein [Solirubrobacteraceae bacterium]|nr:winged helix-turn-helix domain-containing protein [Solirubrobacteraceae bacterium]
MVRRITQCEGATDGAEEEGRATPEHVIDQRIVKALAHPLRIRMLTVLNQRVASPSELAGELEEPIGNVSYHMRTLADLGMVELVRTEPRRGAVEHYYKAIERPHLPAQDWATLPPSVRRSFSDTTGRQVLDDFTGAARSGGFERDGARLNRLELKLDQKGWDELGKVLDDVSQRIEKIAAKAADRKSEETIAASAVLMLFEPRGAAGGSPGGGGRRAKR